MPTSSRREFIKTIGATVGGALGAAMAGAALPLSASAAEAAKGPKAAAAAPGKRPRNILFLMCDQHRPDALGRYGDPYALTPALDALAASGTSFRRTYCQNPVCVPARNAILMGRYSHSMGVLGNGYSTSTDLLSFPQYLRTKGYLTACFGKLHVAGRGDLDWDVKKEGGGKHGGKKPPEGAVILVSGFNGRAPLGAPDPFPMNETMEWQAKEDTIQFMKENRERPWFIQCSFIKPHPPFQPPKEYWDKIDRTKFEIPRYPEDDLKDVHPRLWQSMVQRGLDKLTDNQARDGMQGYYGNLAFADAMHAEVLKALDELGLRDDTLVVYTADHGEMLYHHRLWTKFAFFEQSVRVPLIMSLKGVVPAARETKALVEHVDLFPTFMDFLGFEMPKSVQGRSFISLLRGETDKHRDFVRSEHYRSEDGKTQAYIMQFDGRFKFIDNGPNVAPELYDLQTDPREITSLAAKPEYQDRVKAQTAELRQWVSQDAMEPLRKGGKQKGAADGRDAKGGKRRGKNGGKDGGAADPAAVEDD